MFRNVLIATVAAGSFALAGCGAGGCSDEELAEKANAVGTKMQAMAASDPSAMMKITEKLQAIGSKLADSGDRGEACDAYDALLAEMK